MAYLDREQAQAIYYEDHGTGGDAIVLVHGWGTGVRAWDYNLGALIDAGFRVVALDHRGCGQSDKDHRTRAHRPGTSGPSGSSR